ncbi:MAG: calcium-binding protein [Chloroflexota bacterium]
MQQYQREDDREERIVMEIMVDCHDEEERAMGWYNYLADTLTFPFTTLCRAKRAISPLRIGDEVDVIGMAPEEECQHEIFVFMRWERDGLAVPLSQLAVAYADEETRQAVEDWLYWVDRGYLF